MKRIFKQHIILLCLLVLVTKLYSQQVINYVNGFPTNPNNPSCNIFNDNGAPYTVSGFLHHPISGGALRGTSSPLALRVVGGPNTRPPNAAAGVGYAFSYPIKQGFTYSANVNAYRGAIVGSAGDISFEIGSILNLPDPNQVNTLPTACSEVFLDNLTELLPGRIGNGIVINTNTANNYTVFQNWVASSNRNYFTVMAYGPYGNTNTGAVAVVSINSIIISEIHPFSLSPTTVSLACGTTTS
jgi:hypothetical protein